MRKFLFLFSVCIFFTNTLFSQKIGEWRSYFSYEENLSLLAQGDDNIFAVSDGKLFSYYPDDDSFETYAKIGENEIVNIAYSKKNKCLLIVRSNGDIDLLYKGGNLVNIPDLKNLIENLDKTANDIYIKDDLAYVSMNFGLLVINIAKQEVKESLILKYPVYSASIYDGNLFIATSKGVKMIDPKKNIQNINSWNDISLQGLYAPASNRFNDTEIRQFRDFDEKLAFIVPGKGFYLYDSSSVSFLITLNNPQKMTYSNSGLLLSGASSFINLLKLNDSSDENIRLDIGTTCIIQDKKQANVYWAGIAGKNLVKLAYDPTEKTVTIAQEYMKPNGPLTNYPFSLSYGKGKLLFTGGGENNNSMNYPGRLSEYNNGQWLNYNVQEVTNAINASGVQGSAGDYVSAVVDPLDPSRIYVCTWRSGLLAFKDKKFERLYNHKNSSLGPSYTSGNIVRVGGGVFDKAGNFWFLNSHASPGSIVNVIKAGSTEITGVKEATEPISILRRMIIDKYGRKWIAASNETHYIRVFETNSTLDKIEKSKKIEKGNYVSQDGDRLGITYFNAIAEDLNGNIWLGTDVGIFVIYNSSNIFNSDLVFNKIKVPRNDGTNIVDILLEKMKINTIAVDGANRKWIGTSASGVYVVSGNGQESIHHFDTDNSLLPSNTILSIAIDDENGMVYIGTEKGIVSYRNEATEGAESYSNVYAFPNPIEPDYQGAITIVGLMSNSTVKITDLKGNLINEGKSLGGQYIWDGRNRKKERVETGVYLVFGSSEDGDKGVVTKIMVVTN